VKSKNKTLRGEIQGVPLFVEQSCALPLVSISVARRTGAIFDPPGCEGTSRLLSRLCRRTAGGRPLQTIEEELDRLGSSLGSDATYSSISMSGASIARSVDAFVDLVADATGRPSLDVGEFERLKRESRAEIVEGFDNDRSLAHRALRRTLYPGHAYSRATSGTLSSIERITHATILEHHKATRTRADLVIGMSGDIDFDHATRLAERIVESVPNEQSITPTLTDPLVPDGRRLVVVDKPERAQAQIVVGLSGTKPSDPDHTALHVAMTVFGGTFSSRLMQEIRVERGWSYGAYATLPIDQYRQALTLWTFPSKDDAAACAKLKIDLLEALVERGITLPELSFAKKSLMRSHAFSIDTASKRLGLSLDTELLRLPEDYFSKYEQRVSAITIDEANAALRLRLDPRRLVIAVVGSADALQGQLLSAIANIKSVEVIPFDSPEL
jgi:zinc protease